VKRAEGESSRRLVWSRVEPFVSGQRRRTDVGQRRPLDIGGEDLQRLILSLEDEMHEAAKDLRFEYAARLRDEIAELKRELKDATEAAR
jgi:excinuclease UvrABC helicase subunit UvrB